MLGALILNLVVIIPCHGELIRRDATITARNGLVSEVKAASWSPKRDQVLASCNDATRSVAATVHGSHCKTVLGACRWRSV
jgi:hypothetical protein